MLNIRASCKQLIFPSLYSGTMFTTESAMCHFQFRAVPEIFVDYAEKANQDATFRATALPSLGIIERSYPTDDPVASEQIKLPWERLKSYIEHLNEQESGRASYKVLYITRHGLGYHNVFEAEVGREAWNVKLPKISSNYCSVSDMLHRTTGLTFPAQAISYGRMPILSTRAFSKQRY